ncbi:MAG TPA: alpha/beta hydrolase [Acidimicrobiales bacterium]|jgi:pimeloyl-ACP methyl ester carboxylesterase|nr:alpha/beta hydrolase [Acidimicrobiales bacterium]
MARVHFNGIDFHFEVSGSGGRLMFLNGTGATLSQVSPLVSIFSESFEVLAFDQRGIGLSTCPNGPYTMSDLAAHALALADHVGWETFRLVGISFGGMVAQEVAVRAPGRIDRLALLCTSPGGAGGSSFPLPTLVEMPPLQRSSVSAEIMDTRFTPEWLREHESDRILAGLLGQRFTPKAFSDNLGARLQLQARSGHDVFDRLPRITCPTLVASGRFDGIAPPANGAAIASRISNAELRIYEGGHIFFVQDPKALPDIIEFTGSD